MAAGSLLALLAGTIFLAYPLLLGEFFGDLDLVLLAESESLIDLFARNQNMHSFVILSIIDEKLGCFCSAIVG